MIGGAGRCPHLEKTLFSLPLVVVAKFKLQKNVTKKWSTKMPQNFCWLNVRTVIQLFDDKN
jgi:hypothetical protein